MVLGRRRGLVLRRCRGMVLRRRRCRNRRHQREPAEQQKKAEREKASHGGVALLRWTSPGRAARHSAEEHTSELQSRKRISYAVFGLTNTKQSYTSTLSP